jgi:hypothetical protein
MATQTHEGGDASIPAPRTEESPLLRFLRGWDRFWFGKADPTTLGLIRICCGLVVLYVHFCYTTDLQQLFGRDAWVDFVTMTQVRKDAPWLVPPGGWGDQREDTATRLARMPPPSSPEEAKTIAEYQNEWFGIDPRLPYARGWTIWSVWFHVTDPTWMLVIHTGILAIMFLFTIGFCTRITSVLTWLGALCYIQRAPTTLFGMDTMMMILLLYLMIGPSGAALSVDRLIGRWWANRRARLKGRAAPPWQPPAPSVTANFAIRLMQIHFCIIYLASGTSKLQGAAWWNGTALWGTMANYEFNPLDWQRYEDFLVFLSHHRLLWEVVTSGGVVFTLFLEIGFPFLVWVKQTRWLMIAGAVMLHAGIAMTMGLTTFGLFMLTMLLSFVPPAAVQRLLASVTSRAWWLSPSGGRTPQPAAGLARAG